MDLFRNLASKGINPLARTTRLPPESDMSIRQSLRHWGGSKFMWTHNISINETPQGVALIVDTRVIPRWLPPRNPKRVTLEELALDADGYPLDGYEIPKGERVFLIKGDIYNEKGEICPRVITQLFAPLIKVVDKSNVEMEGYLCYIGHRKKSATQHRKYIPRNRLGLSAIFCNLLCVNSFSSSPL